MDRGGKNLKFVPTLLFAFVLVTAQLALALHAFEHDPSTPQSKVCATCISAGKLASACVDSQQSTMLSPTLPVHEVSTPVIPPNFHECTVRQRGPPALI